MKMTETKPVNVELKSQSPNTQGKFNGRKAKQVAQDNLYENFKELEKSLFKTKEAFSSFKTQCFFFPEPQFTKAFTESIKQAESVVTDMGNRLRTLISKNKDVPNTENKEESKEDQTPSKSAQKDTSFNLSSENSDVLAKISLNITPPASEAGNDDELCAVFYKHTTPSGSTGKRNHTDSKHTSGNQAKKPRRSLVDSYSNKENGSTADAKELSNTTESKNTEVEYEVESIIDFKKTQSQFLYKVSWKGYGPEDCTWEPSAHLTGCEEVLIEFFKSRISERERNAGKTDLNNSLIPLDPNYHEYIVKAFISHVNCPTPKEKERIYKQLFSNTKTVPTKMEINDLVDKALAARKIERYASIKQVLLEQMVFGDIQQQREKQLAQLRNWERNMNAVCSDPAKIVVENTEDLELPPLDFIYINELKAGQGVSIPNDPLLGCECKDCYENQTSCCAKQMNSWFAYNKHGRLKVSLGTPIYECNKRCPCPSTCSNRLVQNGRCFSLSIFRTDNGRGWGVKALEAIKKDSFVVEYVGEVITSEEAEHRGQIYDRKGCTYLFDMDFNNGDQNPYTVDATKYGNVSHFINHSCDPNLVVFNVWVNCLDPDLPRLALFSCRDIRKGEELTFDYNSGLEPEKIKMEGDLLSSGIPNEDVLFTPKKTAQMNGNSSMTLKTPKGSRGLKYGKTECRCGAANCRKYFF